MAGRFKVEAIFKAVDHVTAPVKRMQGRLGKFVRSANRGFHKLNRNVQKFGQGLRQAAAGATVALGAMSLAMGSIISKGANFGRAIGSAASKFPEGIERGSEAFKALERTAREVGATTEFTATEAAQGLNFLAKAGWSANTSMKALGDIVDFATGTELEFAEAADIASDAIGAFGLDSKDPATKLKNLNRVMDVLSKTATSSNTNVSELFDAIKQSAPVATAAGVSMESYSAVLAVLAGTGIKASKAGTATKNVTLALAGIGNKAAANFEKLGIKTADANGDLRDQLDVLDDLRGALSKVAGQEKIDIINAIFGKIPIAAASVLLSDTGKNIRGLRDQMEKAGGTSKRMAAFIRDDVKGSMDGLKSAIEGVQISIFSLNEGPLKGAIDKMTEWVRANEKLIATNIGEFMLTLIENLENIFIWGKRIAIAVTTFLALNAALKAISITMALFNLIMWASPLVLLGVGIFGPIIAAVGLLVVAFKLVFEWLLKVTDGFAAIKAIGGKVASFLEFGDDDQGEGAGPQVVSPGARTARQIDEQRTTNKAEVLLKADAGTSAEVVAGGMGPGIELQRTGTF